MTWAFFSDVHGNLEALEAVAADFEKQNVSRPFFLGDAVGYGGSPNECVDLIADLAEVRLLGNHDEAVLASHTPPDFNRHARLAVDWTRQTMTDKTRSALRQYVMEELREGFCLVHASPMWPERWDYVLDPFDAETAFAGFTGPACFIGHTHQALIFQQEGQGTPEAVLAESVTLEEGKRYVVNVGSVGQPRDGDPRACYVVYDAGTKTLRYRRVCYDIKTAQDKIRRNNLPPFLAARLELGR